MAAASASAAGLERARLEYEGDKIQLLLNPKALTITRQTNWHAPQSRGPNDAQPASAGRSGRAVPLGHGQQQYTGSTPASLVMTVWFDQSFDPDGNIAGDISKLENWTCPTEKVVHNVQSPPRVTFTWGTLVFVGHIQTTRVTYKLFGAASQPVRAEVVITLTENPAAVPGSNPTSGGISGRRVHVISAGDTLHSVAFAEYGSANLWRTLAEANQIDDPLRVAPGTTLLIPPSPQPGGSR